jgi:hypothetical protein
MYGEFSGPEGAALRAKFPGFHPCPKILALPRAIFGAAIFNSEFSFLIRVSWASSAQWCMPGKFESPAVSRLC